MLRKIEGTTYKISQCLTSLALITMVLLTVAEIIMRKASDTSLLIVDEYCGYLMVIVAYWGAVNAFVDGEFVRVDVIYDRMANAKKKIATFVFTISFSLVNALVTWYSWSNTLKTIRRGDVAATISQTPLAVPKLGMAIGLALLELVLVIRIILFVKDNWKRTEGA